MNDSLLKSIALQSGISKNEITNIYHKAINEAKYLGKEHDEDFILSIVKSLSGLDEEDINQTIKNLNTKFLESGYTDFDKFLEDTWDKIEEDAIQGIVSTDFPPSVRPEHMLGHAIKFPPDEEEDNKDEKI